MKPYLLNLYFIKKTNLVLFNLELWGVTNDAADLEDEISLSQIVNENLHSALIIIDRRWSHNWSAH